MFYAHFVLSKRGPLARIWLAAHWDKKLTKAHVFETDLEDSVKTIISPQVKMALRTSGHLLLGVVRIYNRKAKYLLTDCNEAFVKIKMAFRPGVVDLPEENREAQHNQIYLVEEFHNFDTPLPDITDFDINRQLTLNQSRIDEITMPEEVPTAVRLDEGFGGGMMEFGKEAEDRYSAGDLQNMFYKEDDDGKGGSKNVGFGMDSSGMKEGFSAGMGDEGILGGSFMQGPGLFGEGQDGGLFGERSPRKAVEEEINPMENAEGAMDNQIMSPAPPQQPLQIDEEATLKENVPEGFMNQPIEQIAMMDQQPMEVDQHQVAQHQENVDQQQQQQQEDVTNRTEVVEDTTSKDQTTLVANEEEAFALEPLDVTGVRDLRMRRKRKLIVDHVMELDGQTMRDQLKDFNDIVTTLDMAPPTKRLMQWKEMGGVEKLFSLPSRTAGDDINKLFGSNLHHSIPSDLLDVTGTQLHQQFGEVSNEQEISAVPDVRDDNMVNDMRIDPHSHTTVDPTESVLMQDKDPSMNQANMPAAYNSDDDYEAYSVGPQSVGSSVGDRPGPQNIGGQTPHPNPLPENTMLSGLDVPATDMPSLNETGMSEFPMLPSPEGESFADDVDDLRWNKRTQHLLHSLQRSFKHEQEVSLFQMTEGITRKQAVSKFYSLLVLAKQEATHLVQSQTFGDVYISQGPKFESILM